MAGTKGCATRPGGPDEVANIAFMTDTRIQVFLGKKLGGKPCGNHLFIFTVTMEPFKVILNESRGEIT
mgnify:CR=1 FL=1